MLWITFSPITTSVQEYYGIDSEQVLEFSDAFMYTYFMFSFLVSGVKGMIQGAKRVTDIGK